MQISFISYPPLFGFWFLRVDFRYYFFVKLEDTISEQENQGLSVFISYIKELPDDSVTKRGIWSLS
jgi:hypothetical protein